MLRESIRRYGANRCEMIASKCLAEIDTMVGL